MRPLCPRVSTSDPANLVDWLSKEIYVSLRSRVIRKDTSFLSQDIILLGLALQWKASFVTHSKMERVHLGESVTDGSSSSQVP